MALTNYVDFGPPAVSAAWLNGVDQFVNGGINNLILNNTAQAGANTAALQTAITAGGLINLTQAGIIYINTTLVYGSQTCIIASPKTTIQMIPGISLSLLKSTAEVNFSAGGASVTLTQGTGLAVNVAWNNHGLLVNQGVWIAGCNTSGYNGVWRVAAVVDANNFTIYIVKSQTVAPAGTIIAIPAVQNFSLIGGTWNYDYPNNSTGNNLDNHCIRGIGLIDCQMDGVTAENAAKYAFVLNAVQNVNTKNLQWLNPHSDGIKVYGPSRSVYIDGCSGVTGDDFISLHTREGSGSSSSQLVYGDIFDCHVRGLVGVPQASGSVLHLYPSDTEDFDMVSVEDVNGQFGNIFIGITGFTIGQMGKIVFKKINVTSNGNSTSNILLSQVYTIDDLTFEDIDFNPQSTLVAGLNSLVASSGTVGTVKNLTFNRIRSSALPSGASGALSICAFGGGTFTNVLFRDCELVGSALASGINLATFSGTYTIGVLTIQGCLGDSNSKYLVSFGSVPQADCTIRFIGNHWSGSGFMTSGTGTRNYTIKMIGNEILGSQSLGTFRMGNTGNTRVVSDGTNDYVTGAVFVNAGGTPTLTLFGYDIPFDVTNAAVLQTVANQYCNSTTTGTGKQGSSVKINTASTNTWYALATSAGTNTLVL